MMRRIACVMTVLLAGAPMGGCQKASDPDDVISYDEIVDVASNPSPVVAAAATDGKTYRVVRGNNQPDDILPYDWHTVFGVSVVLNANANDEDVDMAWPVKLTATTLTVKQASGGIVTPPTGGETEKYEFVTLDASGNTLAGVGNAVNLNFEVWYDLPNLKKEAVVTVNFSFIDDDGRSFQKSEDILVAP